MDKDDLHRLEKRLNYIINYVEVDDFGNLIEKRQLIDRIGNIKIEIYENEHPPPHFHIKSPDWNATFTVVDCQCLTGAVSPQMLKKIRYFHSTCRNKLIEIWNKSRPENCPVGKIDIG